MKTVGLIGLGTITKRYPTGLNSSRHLKLRAVSDVDPCAVSRTYYKEYPFYSDYMEMLASEPIEIAIISTPPETHYEIASRYLGHGVGVMIEKPAVLCMKQFDLLSDLAEKNDLPFITMFHWQGGIETIAFKNEYDLSGIKEIMSKVCDPYSDDGESINENRRSLMGAWADSGVNILSMIAAWLPFETAEIASCESVRCKKTQLPIYVSVKLRIDKIPVNIEIDWSAHKDKKESYVTIGKENIHIDHSSQSIRNETTATNYTRMERLDEHYYSIFTEPVESNVKQSRLIHKLLTVLQNGVVSCGHKHKQIRTCFRKSLFVWWERVA